MITKSDKISNIDINKQYDLRAHHEEIHYESFAKLAAFFGRNMQAHWHDQYFQIHFLEIGQIELLLDHHHYSVQAPLYILTPPSVPHAFITESNSDGHVLTVHQELIWPLLEKLYPGQQDSLILPAICQSLADNSAELTAIKQCWQLIDYEFNSQNQGRSQTLILLSQTLLTLLLRNTLGTKRPACGMRGELKLFHRFNQLIDEHYQQHWPVKQYADKIGVTEARLNDLCQRFSNLSPKRLIFEKIIREAKRLLLFSSCSILEIAYQLGFKDPAYFSRFFNRMEGCSPSTYRLNQPELVMPNSGDGPNSSVIG